MDFHQLSAIARKIVESTRQKLPADIRSLAKTVPVLIQRWPDKFLVEDGVEEDTLGLFNGSPYGSDLRDEQPMPPQIFLYLENIWDMVEGDPEEFRNEVRLTYLHELGHYFGWDEEEIAARGLE